MRKEQIQKKAVETCVLEFASFCSHPEFSWCPHIDIKEFRDPKSGVIGLIADIEDRDKFPHKYTLPVGATTRKGTAEAYVYGRILASIRPQLLRLETRGNKTVWAPVTDGLRLFEFYHTPTWTRIYKGMPVKVKYNLERNSATYCLGESIAGIWNFICTVEGAATMEKDVFDYFLSTLNSYVNVLYGPAGQGPVTEIDAAGKEVFSKRLPDFSSNTDGNRWKRANIKNPCVKHELLSFREHYNKSVYPLPNRSTMEAFVKESYESFNKYLEQEKFLIICGYPRCKRLALYHPAKKCCSLEVEGRNCRELRYQRNRRQRILKRTPLKVS